MAINRPIHILKFGGSALATTDGIRRAASRICSLIRDDFSLIVVADAMGDSITQLESLAEQVASPAPLQSRTRDMDLLKATGEIMSSALLAMAINAHGHPAVALTGWQAGITTDSVFSRAGILSIEPKRIIHELVNGRVVVVAGSQGIDRLENITTMGRDGADTTAVALAAYMGVSEVELFTDTDGLFTADPRIVPTANQIPNISYDEMLELVTLGAGVINPRAIEYAKRASITLHIRSSFSTLPGTIVKEEGQMQIGADVRGVAHDTDISKLALIGVPDQPGIAYKVFDRLSQAHINVDMIVQSQKDAGTNDILFTCGRGDADTALKLVQVIAEELGAKGVVRDDKVAKVSIVGAGMANNPGVAARMFGALAKRDINIEVISTSEIRISCLLPVVKVEDAVRAVHEEFGL